MGAVTTRRAAEDADARGGAPSGWAIAGVLTGLVVAATMVGLLLVRTRNRLDGRLDGSPWLDRVLEYDVDWYLGSLRRLSAHVPAGPWAGVLVGVAVLALVTALAAAVVRRRRA
ncbi:hypothetical protein [Cellulomonas xiejunii]|uniref:hypothetical protein n=1 Tax=Cellulomonas xiejunii TaxID=2968083 RepID=UPI001D0E4233|nr:hypothetical protein [Cellulomonas xiejunii]MCC2314230.1 hypothetical protein [Cellulomonas xiejunii]